MANVPLSEAFWPPSGGVWHHQQNAPGGAEVRHQRPILAAFIDPLCLNKSRIQAPISEAPKQCSTARAPQQPFINSSSSKMVHSALGRAIGNVCSQVIAADIVFACLLSLLFLQYNSHLIVKNLHHIYAMPSMRSVVVERVLGATQNVPVTCS